MQNHNPSYIFPGNVSTSFIQNISEQLQHMHCHCAIFSFEQILYYLLERGIQYIAMFIFRSQFFKDFRCFFQAGLTPESWACEKSGVR